MLLFDKNPSLKTWVFVCLESAGIPYITSWVNWLQNIEYHDEYLNRNGIRQIHRDNHNI